MFEGRWEKFGGRWMYVQRHVETVAEMMRRCREADAERAAKGEQDQFLLESVHELPESRRWQDKYFGR